MSERLEDIVAARRKKLEAIKAAGIDPYPSVSERSHTNKQAADEYDNLQNIKITLVGRIRSFREMGKLVFVHIEDGSAKIQSLLKSDNIGEENFKKFLAYFDIGDFVEITGTLFTTKTGEKTLLATGYKLLAKSLLPLPSEHYGLSDEETRLRQRYLDILLNPESKDLFVKKNLFWSNMRKFLVDNGFLETEMPILEAVPGGAEAEPFITHHNALDRDFYLRISLELPLKKMLVAGYEKVFEIGRIFRNEGIDTEHLQDYTQMEFYWAYGDFEKMMEYLEKMYQFVIEKTFGTLEITSRGITCDWSGKWEKISYIDLFKSKTGLDLNSSTDEDLKKYISKNHLKIEESAHRGKLIDTIFKSIRSSIPLNKPVFLIDQPIELEPLAKKDPNNPKIVQRLQIIAYGTELGKGFGELNDPIDQRARFEEQMQRREAGDKEAQFIDFDYLEAMEYGMPPAAGFGVSQRLFAFLVDKPIRETIVFPPMKEVSNAPEKSKETKIAVAILNNEADLEPWQKFNTIAHLNTEFGIHQGKKLLLQDEISTKDGEHIKLNAQHAIIIKTAGSSTELRDLSSKAKAKGLEVAEFTREMLETTDDKKVIAKTKEKNLDEIEFLGVLVFGAKNEVEKLTADFILYK